MKPKGQNPTATIKLAKHKQNSHLSQMTLAKWRERQRTQNLLDGEGNASSCDGSQKEKGQSDPKEGAPRESHPKPPSLGPALLLLVFVDCLLQCRPSSQTPYVCQVFPLAPRQLQQL